MLGHEPRLVIPGIIVGLDVGPVAARRRHVRLAVPRLFGGERDVDDGSSSVQHNGGVGVDVDQALRRNGGGRPFSEEFARTFAIDEIDAVDEPEIELGTVGQQFTEKRVLRRARSATFMQNTGGRAVLVSAVGDGAEAFDDVAQVFRFYASGSSFSARS